MNRRQTQNLAAFTLLELVLVLALLALVVGSVAPSLRGFTVGRSYQNDARTIVNLAGYARTQAISEGVTYRLNFDPKSNSVWLTREDGATFTAPPNDFGERHSMAAGLRLDVGDMPQRDDGQYVEFQPTGRTEPATVRLLSTRGDEIEIACASATETFRIVPAREMTR